MSTSIRALLVVIASIVLIGVVFGQTNADGATATVRIPGRVIDVSGFMIPTTPVPLVSGTATKGVLRGGLAVFRLVRAAQAAA